MKVTVIQPGSRRRYFLPQLFEKRGMLEMFATDFTTQSWSARTLKWMGWIRREELRIVDPHKIVSPDISVLFLSLVSGWLWGARGAGYHRKVAEMITQRLKKRGLGRTTTIYCMGFDFADYLEYVKAEEDRVRIVCDVYMHPSTDRIWEAAARQFPEWHSQMPCHVDVAARECLFARTAKIADILLCPSAWVAEGVKDTAPRETHKVRVCPYGSSIDYAGRANRPVKGRFLWAGVHPVLKGLPYLASAANKLRPRYPDMDFRVAGITDKRIIEMPQCRDLHFLGRLSKAQMQEEFLSADAFVLPTLCEGLAGVLVEAVACGCPVVTTRCGGLDITDGQTGILIPEGDEAALVHTLERTYIDRDLRAHVAANLPRLAAVYSMQAWAERVVTLMEGVANTRECAQQHNMRAP